MAQWGEAKEILDNLANQRRSLTIIQTTGEYQFAFAALGVSRSSWQRYCRENPSFEQDCKVAKQYYKVQKQVDQALLALQVESTKELVERVKSGRAKDSTLVALALQHRKRKE